MSQTDIDQLIQQLSSQDPKDRRLAAKRLGELKRPEAIPELATVYTGDEDESVRKTAGEALRIFRRMEQEERAELEGEQFRSGLSHSMFTRLRGLLVITLALMLIANAAILVSRALPGPGKERPVQTTPTPRDQLVVAFRKQIDDVHGEALFLRQLYSNLQGMGVQALIVGQAQCQKLQDSPVNVNEMGNVDYVTYPDLKDVNDQINQVVLALIPLRNNYIALCAIKDPKEISNQIAALGKLPDIVAKIDAITNRDLANAQASLKRAIDNPAPTVGPTFTPTTPPTATPAPTNTQGPSTATAPVTQGSSATQPAGGAATGVATAAPTSASSITFNGLGLDTLKSYKYQVTASTEGTYTNGKSFSGSLKITASRQVSPLAAEYDVRVTDSNTRDFNAAPTSSVPQIKSLAGALYVANSGTFVIADNVLYQVIGTPPKCQANRVTGTKGAMQDFSFPDLAGLQLSAKAPDDKINGIDVKHYHGEKQGGFNNLFTEAVDLYVSADTQLPVRLVETVSQPPATKTPSPTGYNVFSLTIQYDLQAQNQDVRVLKPLVCDGVPVK